MRFGPLVAGIAWVVTALLVPSTAAAVTFARSDLDVGRGAYSVATGDFNDDGDPDLAVGNGLGDDNHLSTFLGQPGDGFEFSTDVALEDVPSALAVGDFNGDDDPDLAAGHNRGQFAAEGTVSVLLGQPGGGFEPRRIFDLGNAFPRSVAVGDFDRNGDQDLAVACADGKVSVLLGQPGGDFGSRTDYELGHDARSVAVGDFNGDDDLDLAVAVNNNEIAPNQDVVSVLLGQPGAGFGPKTDYTASDVTFSEPRSVAVGDFNGDDDPDLAVANTSADTVAVFVGGPGGGFGQRTEIAVGNLPWAVVAGDFNSDDDPDLAVTHDIPGAPADLVSVLLGEPGSGFGTKTEFAVGKTGYSVVADDFNGDTDLDLAVANLSSHSVSVLLNTSVPAVDVSPSDVRFPVTPRGTTSARQDVTLRNTGESSLTVSSTAIVGANADAFVVSANTCTDAPVRPRRACTISLSFQPISEGPANATLEIRDNAPDSPQRVALGGVGGPPPTPAFAANPSSVNFGNQVVGGSSAAKRITVTNMGTGSLAIGSTALSGVNSRDFAIAADTCGGETVQPGGTCAVALRFAPRALGLRNASLVFTDNAAGSPHSVALRGRGCLLVTAPVCL